MDTFAQPPVTVLARFAPVHLGLRWVRVVGGFSGAEVWRGDDANGNPIFALKAWPGEVLPDRVMGIHGWLKQAAHLPFVSRVIPATDGTTAVVDAGRVWDVTTWMPGTPRESPGIAEVEAACAAVARLHASWPKTRSGPCPGMRNRVRVLTDWIAAPLPPKSSERTPSPLPALLRRAQDIAVRQAPAALGALQPWAAKSVPLRHCVRDLRGEHVLFQGAEVTGIVDYGAMAEDSPAVDLARLLGDFSSHDEKLFTAGLNAYHDAGGILGTPEEFVRRLNVAGTVCSLIGWLVRLRGELGAVPNVNRIAGRLEQLVARLE